MGMTQDKMISRDHNYDFWFVKRLADTANNHIICVYILLGKKIDALQKLNPIH